MIFAERALVLVLRTSAAVLLTALVPAAMPWAWMDAIHRWLGLGELPDRPVVEYLCRSASALYAYHGAVLLYVSFDLQRFLPVLKCLLWLGVAFGASMIVIDAAAGLPTWWVLGEGPGIVVLCGTGLLLVRGVERAP